MKKVLFSLLVLIILMGTVVACSREAIPGKTVQPMTTQTTLIHGPGFDSNGMAPPVIITQAPMPTVTVPPMTITAGKGGESYSSIQVATINRMVIRNGNLTMVVDDVSTALLKITALASANGGFVVNSNIQEDQSRLYANIAFRVDSTKFDAVLQALRNMAVDVKAESTSGQDVTEQYVDLTSQLRNLAASEAQLLELMKQAGKVEEILAVQQQLTSTRGQIEQIKGQMQYLEQSSSLAMINVSLEQSKLTVEFNADTRIVKVGEAVQFVPAIAGGISPYSYEWNFGDGGKSTEPNPSHAYSKTGTFTVNVKITDDKGNTDEYTRTDYITVNVVPGWSAGNIAGDAWHGLVGFFKVLLNILIWIGILSLIWIPILVILYFTWWRKRKNKANTIN
jgi:hypothetical protein